MERYHHLPIHIILDRALSQEIFKYVLQQLLGIVAVIYSQYVA